LSVLGGGIRESQEEEDLRLFLEDDVDEVVAVRAVGENAVVVGRVADEHAIVESFSRYIQ